MSTTVVSTTFAEEERTHARADGSTSSSSRSGSSSSSGQGKVLAAGAAAVVSSFVTTPLDVVKTRMQTHSSASFSGGSSSSACSRVSTHRNPVRRMVQQHGARVDMQHGNLLQSLLARLQASAGSLHQRTFWRPDEVALCHCASTGPPMLSSPHVEVCTSAARQLRGAHPTMMATLHSIYYQEGVRVLWRGLDSSLLISVPMVGIYMPMYDVLREQLTSSKHTQGGLDLGVYAPAVAGMLARMVAVLATAPLELVRTRQQALSQPPPTSSSTAAAAVSSPSLAGLASSRQLWPASSTSSWGVMRNILSGPSGSMSPLLLPRLWAGVGATVARDVPFTAIYWSLLEPTRKLLLQQQRQQPPANDAVFGANLVAGAGAGAIAAVATTPADVLKTRLQTTGGNSFEILRKIMREDGASGLMRGWAPRAARTAPACAIVIASYELLKTVL